MSEELLSFTFGSTLVEGPVVALQVDIPQVYQDLREAFSKTCATWLPSHRPWDCAIDLLKDCWWLKPMEKYIQEALQQSIIRPSTSPA